RAAAHAHPGGHRRRGTGRAAAAPPARAARRRLGGSGEPQPCLLRGTAARGRAGAFSVRLLREAGLGARLEREGLQHGGISLQFAGERQHIDLRDLTGGRTVTVYAQTEVVKDLIAARLADGAQVEFEISGTEVDDLDTARPVLRYTMADGSLREVSCDAITACDGFPGICWPTMPAALLSVWARDYPFAWLGIFADVPHPPMS